MSLVMSAPPPQPLSPCTSSSALKEKITRLEIINVIIMTRFKVCFVYKYFKWSLIQNVKIKLDEI